jgi:hypothetical protein
MTRASVDKTFTGDIDGEGHAEYVMMYRSDGDGGFRRTRADYRAACWQKRQLRAPTHRRLRDGHAKESYFVVTGSGNDELRGLRGEATSSIGHAADYLCFANILIRTNDSPTFRGPNEVSAFDDFDARLNTEMETQSCIWPSNAGK